MINKIGHPCSRSLICLITSIADLIGQFEVLLPINHNYNNICDLKDFFLSKTQEIPRGFLQAVKKSHLNLSERMQWCILSNYLGITSTVLHCPISAEMRTVDSPSDMRILL